MALSQTQLWVRASAASMLLIGSAGAQVFQDNTAQIPSGNPFNNSSSENIDFADVDLDGDWDAAFADGGDCCNDQNRLWINLGGAQGGTIGFFDDRTSTQFPTFSDQSRDIEFVDIEGDGDQDIYVSNTSTAINQSNRWWVNQGGLQGGTAGFFQDDPSRFVNLNSGNTSIPASDILSDGFRDWSCDCDFGDLDNDGDLDLVHSSYGGAFGGQVPTRIFLNDGAGFFSEFNPSGFRLSNSEINSGNPGLWCEGTQQTDTNNSTGANCDIASSALDIDLGDIDGDFDLDILHGARQEVPRMFVNRLDGSNLAPAQGGGQIGFRDVSTLVFPSGWSTGDGHYEQEMADLDGDGDLDIYGLNWAQGGFGAFTDITLRNTGNGTFDQLTTLSGSNDDDNEGDFIDYDNDGDLDLFVCNFSGQDRLYRNNNNGGSTFSLTNVTAGNVPGSNFIGLDADACDVDDDGDYDLIVSNDNGARNQFHKNMTNTPDTTAPYLPNLEQAPDRMPGAAPTVVRVHVYDNAPYYITWFNETWLEVSNGGPTMVIPMMSSAGQIFRGEIPGNLTGTVSYQVFSMDAYGNMGSSDVKTYSNGGPPPLFTSYCQTSPNSSGSSAMISAIGSNVVSDNNLTLSATVLPNNVFGLFFFGNQQIQQPFGDGFRCVGGGIFRLPILAANGATLSQAVNFNAGNGTQLTAGTTWNFQAWFRDTMGFSGFNLSNGMEITFQ